MPRVTPRLRRLRQLRAILRLNVGLTVYQAIQDAIAEPDIDLSDSSNSSDTDDTDDTDNSSSSDDSSDNEEASQAVLPPEFVEAVYNALNHTKESRYILPRVILPKSSDWYDNIAQNENPKRYKAHFRVSKLSYEALLRLIEHHPVFYNNSTCEQTPVSKQLHVALYYFGCDGSAGSWIQVGSRFGIGEGTVQLFVNRVLTAILYYEDNLVKWPQPGSEHYQQMIDMHLHLHGFPNCLGFVDSSHFNIFRRPFGQGGNTFWNHHDRYSLNGMFIVDAETRILFTALGCILPHNKY